MATRPRTENNPFAYGMRLLAVFYNEMEKNKDKISFIKSYHPPRVQSAARPR